MFNYKNYSEDQCDFVSIGSIDSVNTGERVFVTIDDRSIVVFGIAGEIFAIADICSHDDGPIGDGEIAEYEISCPRHGAKFDIRTGKAITLPAIIDIPAYPVRIRNGEIEIGIPRE